MRRLLTIGHSYVVGLNRRLAHEMAIAGAGAWDVTAVAPTRYPGDLRMIELERVPDERCAVIPVDVKWSARPHVMHYGRALRDVLRRDWDMIHCWEEPFINAGHQVSRLARPGVPIVYGSFQNIAKRYPLPFNAMERQAMRRASGWVAFGDTVATTLRERRGYSDRPHRVITPGVDTSAFQPDAASRAQQRSSFGWNERSFVVGYVGRFIEAKGLRVLMAALDHTPGDWNALFVGGGPLERDIRSWGARYGARVRVITNAQHNDVPGIMRALDVLCVPSLTTRTWREQLGRVIIEAFASSVTVIGSDSGEIPHLIRGDGVIVPEADAARLARAIGDLRDNPSQRERLAGRALVRARTEHTWEQAAHKHLDFFDSLLQDGQSCN